MVRSVRGYQRSAHSFTYNLRKVRTLFLQAPLQLAQTHPISKHLQGSQVSPCHYELSNLLFKSLKPDHFVLLTFPLPAQFLHKCCCFQGCPGTIFKLFIPITSNTGIRVSLSCSCPFPILAVPGSYFLAVQCLHRHPSLG